MGPSCGSFSRVVGPPRALVGLRLGSFSVSFGALVAFGVRVLRDVVDFSCHGGQVEAFRGVSEASGGHFGGQNLSKIIEKPKAAQSKRQHSRPYPGNAAQRRANMSSAEQGTAEQGNAQQSTASQRTAQHSIAHNAEASRQAALRNAEQT